MEKVEKEKGKSASIEAPLATCHGSALNAKEKGRLKDLRKGCGRLGSLVEAAQVKVAKVTKLAIRAAHTTISSRTAQVTATSKR